MSLVLNRCTPYLDTARHLSIFLGTRASCSTSGVDISSLPCQRIFPVSASRKFIQFTLKPLSMSSAREGIFRHCYFQWQVQVEKPWKRKSKANETKTNWNFAPKLILESRNAILTIFGAKIKKFKFLGDFSQHNFSENSLFSKTSYFS